MGGCTSRQSEEEAGFEMAVFQKKYVFFPGEGFKGSEGSKCLYSGRVWVPEIHERGREMRKDRFQQRVRS